MFSFEPPGDELRDGEYPDEDDFGGDNFDDDNFDGDNFDDDSETVPCPRCGGEIYEDSERCPHCGDYVTPDTNALSGRSWWWILLGLAGVVAAIAALILAGF